MSDYSFLKPGLRWAREKRGINKQLRGEWCILKIIGNPPFFKCEIVYKTHPENIWSDLYDPNHWEYGPEIDIPNKDWVEVNAMKAKK